MTTVGRRQRPEDSGIIAVTIATIAVVGGFVFVTHPGSVVGLPELLKPSHLSEGVVEPGMGPGRMVVLVPYTPVEPGTFQVFQVGYIRVGPYTLPLNHSRIQGPTGVWSRTGT